MFSLLRIVFGLILFIGSFYGLSRLLKKSKKLCVILALVVTIAAITMISAFPIENLFIRFDSPEQAAQYKSNQPILLSVSGQSSALVISGKDTHHQLLFVPKADDGWLVSAPDSGGRVVRHSQQADLLSEGIAIMVYRYKETDDYYIIVTYMGSGIPEVRDNHQSQFYTVNKQISDNDFSGGMIVAYVSHFDGSYQIIVDGNAYPI